ncbi:MAG: MutS family DNA mismatch repair protein [Lachnospiraceae bacterium]|nr:MutS family DNA mismatch repair protein [Lachnospiraceae bacterium]
MEYLVIGMAVVILLAGKGIYDKRKYKQKVRRILREDFGTVSEEEYTQEKLKALQSFYQAVKRDTCDVDDITWNDLELDELFMVMNRTVSAMGEEYLYAMLRQPQFDPEEMKERERLISFFERNEEKRIDVQEALYQIGKHRKYSVYECMNYIKNIKRESNLPHILAIVLLFGAVAFAFLKPSVGVIATVVVISYNLVSYMKRKGELDAYLSSVTYLIRLLYATEDVAKLSVPELSGYVARMKELNKHFAAFKRNFWIIGSRKPTGDMMDMVVSYFRMLFHIDLIKFNGMLKIYDKHVKELNELYEVVGYLDALCSVASFRALLGAGGYCVPELLAGMGSETPVYEAEELYHPLLEAPVTNSIRTDKSVLLTGSNASGKSTFLKSVAIGAILAQTVHTVPAKSYRASYFQVLSSMALRDNMQGNESYFIVEIKSLKRIFEAAKAQVCTLCFVDEVLRGTNTVERIAASREVLSGIARSGRTICFAATHDIELTYLLEQECDNYHFEETVTDDKVEFDYLLHEGRATSRNAIKLLRMLGYPQEVIERAEYAAEHFLMTGEWN